MLHIFIGAVFTVPDEDHCLALELQDDEERMHPISDMQEVAAEEDDEETLLLLGYAAFDDVTDIILIKGW